MIRFATLEDIPEIMVLCRKFHDESLYRILPLDEAKLTELFHVAISDEDWCLCVSESNGIQGIGLGVIREHFFSRSLVASDLFFYVGKESRGKMAGLRLVSFFTGWAKSMGAEMIQIGITTGIDTQKTARLYSYMGYEATGVVFNWCE